MHVAEFAFCATAITTFPLTVQTPAVEEAKETGNPLVEIALRVCTGSCVSVTDPLAVAAALRVIDPALIVITVATPAAVALLLTVTVFNVTFPVAAPELVVAEFKISVSASVIVAPAVAPVAFVFLFSSTVSASVIVALVPAWLVEVLRLHVDPVSTSVVPGVIPVPVTLAPATKYVVAEILVSAVDF